MSDFSLRQPDRLGRFPRADNSLATAVAFGALAAAAAAITFGAPPLFAGAFALISLGAAGIAALQLVRAPSARALVASMAEPVAVTSANGSLVATNARFEAMMAQTDRVAHPDALADSAAAALALFALRRRALADGAADGFIPPELFARVTYQDGNLVHVFEAVRPPKSEASRGVDAMLVNLIPGAAAIVERDGSIRAANAQYRAVCGDGGRLADGLNVDAPTVARLVAQAQEDRASRVDAALARAPDRRMRLSAKPYPGAAGTVLIAVTDVTEQSDLEMQIAQSQKMQAIGQLAGGIAHDFNNVLTAIIGFSDLLLQSHRPSDPAFRDIMNIKQSAQRAAGLVKQLLAFSRKQTLKPTVLNLNDALADLSMMLGRLLGEKVRLELSYGRDLWPVLADLSQLEQVVINLAVNARDAMKGGGTLSIRTRNVPATEIEGRTDGFASDAVVLEIEDTGTGMPQGILDKIFEPFFTTKATGEGTGLGLSTVYGIVKQTGGSLDVASAPGKGTMFRVLLPRTEAEVRVPAPAESRDAPAQTTDLTGSATLLLVEDEEAIRTFAARALSAKGYHVLSAATGVEAAEIFAERAGEVDLVLTDVMMPELDGPSLVRKIRAARPELKVIFMSGYADGASVDELGDAPFLQKPFTLKALAEAVKRELGRGG